MESAFHRSESGMIRAEGKLGSPLLLKLRRDLHEKVAEEFGMDMNWMAHKMWAFGPAKRLIQRHLATPGTVPHATSP